MPRADFRRRRYLLSPIYGGVIGGTPAVASPNILLSSQMIAEDAALTDVIGVLSVSNPGAAVWTFTIEAGDDPDDKFDIADDTDLIVDGALDFETDPSHLVTITATPDVGDAITRQFTITVTDVVEVPALELVLTWVSDNTDLDPDFEVNYVNGVPLEADELTLSIYEDAGLTILHDSDVNTLDAGEVAAGTITFGAISPLTEGQSYWAVVEMVRGSDPTVTSNTETKTMIEPGVAGDFFPNRYFSTDYFPARYFG